MEYEKLDGEYKALFAIDHPSLMQSTRISHRLTMQLKMKSNDSPLISMMDF